ncbi:hypothetical protein [Salirhabdus salicampi]|uniref:hypothetical protein n=1 Tax=Salirhabdus salicampi TaxID=476102 RepID=UPI0020C4549C|nr:hypothetical protein [Salirhabdus salicampi]MCP8616708.1 hypothetical protein [Salirhabdus salicampi]
MLKRNIIMMLTIMFTLTGCLYPQDRLEKNQVPNDIQLNSVQEAIDTYRERNNGWLPIKTRDKDTEIFLKYPIHFKDLKEQNIIPSTPGNAFEEGGPYQYVIIHPEDQPTVKLVDLRLANSLRQLATKLEFYRNKHLYPPFGDSVGPGIYEIHYEKLGLDQKPFVVSPFTGNNLPVLITTEGNLIIDYRIDLYDALQTYEHEYNNGDDIRYLLTDHKPFVPAYSVPYTVKDGEPIFAPNLTEVQ